jgi:hypothetical protein
VTTETPSTPDGQQAAEPDSHKESGSDFDRWLKHQLPYERLSDASKYQADILLGKTPPPGCG